MHGLPARLAGDLLEAADFLRAFGEPLQLARFGAEELAHALSSPQSGTLWRRLNLLQVPLSSSTRNPTVTPARTPARTLTRALAQP